MTSGLAGGDRADPDAEDVAAPRPATFTAGPVLRIAAALSWRVLVVGAAFVLVLVVLSRLSLVVVPVVVALLLAALLTPAVAALVARGVPRAVAAAAVLVVGLGVLVAAVRAVVAALTDALPQLLATVSGGLQVVQEWSRTGPLRALAPATAPLFTEAAGLLQGDPTVLTTGVAGTALGLAVSLGEFATGALLVLFVLIFLLADGARVWAFVLLGVPAGARPLVQRAGRRAFGTVAEHLYGQALTAGTAALATGVGLTALGVPLALPLAAVVAVGGFVPVVGPLTAGVLVVLATLVVGGPATTLVAVGLLLGSSMVARLLLVPTLLGRTSPLHPLATVLAVAVGVAAAGVVGALTAVPLLAALRGAAGPVRRARARRSRRRRVDHTTTGRTTAPPSATPAH